MNTRCGFVAVIGAPNAGKSTLVNAMVGAKVAIVTPKVQTTRNRILGITAEDQTQMIFIDTPGVFQASARFEQAMVGSALASTKEADAILVVVDARKGICDNTKQVLESIKNARTRKALVLNKIDKVEKTTLLDLASRLFAMETFEECFMVSALKGSGLDALTQWLAATLPEDVWHYPEDQMTDIPMRQLAAETTRESLFYRLREELPYSVFVETEQWEERKDGSVEIRQVIYVQNENQKTIIIGRKGAMLKAIGEAARTHIGKFLDRKVHLFLFVKVTPDWKKKKSFYTSIGLDYG